MFTPKQLALSLAPLAVTLIQAQNETPTLGPSTFIAPGTFPTSAFSRYFNSPTATSAQVQPVVSDPVLHKVYPASLTSPKSIPVNNTHDPHPLPPKASASLLLNSAFEQVVNIVSNPAFGNSTCTKCIASLEVIKFIGLAAPELVSTLAVRLCEEFKLSTTCVNTYSDSGLGSVITQVFANADVGGFDGMLICDNFFSACPHPPTLPLNLTGWFAKPKPNPLPPPRKPSGKRLRVLQISDFHIDPRYATGAEANCTSGLCCRANNPNPDFTQSPSFPAPRFGSFTCDTPYALALSVLEAIPALTGTEKSGFAFTMYTGDLVSHDPDNQLSRDYILYAETVLYGLFKRFLGAGPVYAVLGNHDTYNVAQDAPHSMGGNLAAQFSWNYDHVAGLWEHEKWLPEGAVKQSRAHYGAYSVQRYDGLRIIALNTDFWYRSNYFNYINTTSHDTSGMLRFLTDELQEAEDAGDRAFILGHVLTGWDGTDPMDNPTNLFYQIVDRFTPHVIANVFFGHTHQDQFSIYYANNGTVMSAETARAVSWMGPSVTPGTGLNVGFRVYDVDSGNFDVLDAYTFSSDVSTYPSLDHQLKDGPTFSFEYSTRDTYGPSVPGWDRKDPLNATWWHHVTEAMLNDPSLVSTFTTFQGKSSVKSPPCNTTECIEAKVCYMRSGSVSLARQNCIPGFGSVEG